MSSSDVTMLNNEYVKSFQLFLKGLFSLVREVLPVSGEGIW